MVEETRSEFSRQAPFMAAAPAFNQQQMLDRMCVALGSGPTDRVLEVACGPGIVADVIAPLVSELVCTDATPAMIALARERLEKSGQANVTFQEALAEELPFGAAEFDAIVTRLAFHHFADIQAVLAEFRRVLRPHGRLIVADIISSPNREEADLHNALEQLRDPTHVHMFSKAELLTALQIGGFKSKTEESWKQARNFSEWAGIVAVPERTGPIRQVMQALCRAGLDAGIQLRESEGELQFNHQWLLVVAEPLQ